MKAGLAGRRIGVICHSYSRGISNEAQTIQCEEAARGNDRDSSSSIDNIDSELSIFNIYDCCSKDNWDGYDAKAVTPSSWYGVLKLVRCLPDDFPKPEATISPYGMMVLEWYRQQDYILAITIENENKLSYNALFGTDEDYGIAAFDQDLPEAIFYNLQRLFKN
jgi:hypothetical protein